MHFQLAGGALASSIGKSLKKKISRLSQKAQTTNIASNPDMIASPMGGTASLFSSPAKFGVTLES